MVSILDSPLAEVLDAVGVDPAAAAEIQDIDSAARLESLRDAFGLARMRCTGALIFAGRLPEVAPRATVAAQLPLGKADRGSG